MLLGRESKLLIFSWINLNLTTKILNWYINHILNKMQCGELLLIHLYLLWRIRGSILIQLVHLSVCPLVTSRSLVSSQWCLQFLMNSYYIIWHKWWEGVSCVMTFTSMYIFKVIQPWNYTAQIWHIIVCLFYSMCSSRWIPSIFGTNDL